MIVEHNGTRVGWCVSRRRHNILIRVSLQLQILVFLYVGRNVDIGHKALVPYVIAATITVACARLTVGWAARFDSGI
jgi:hypothetical protein